MLRRIHIMSTLRIIKTNDVLWGVLLSLNMLLLKQIFKYFLESLSIFTVLKQFLFCYS